MTQRAFAWRGLAAMGAVSLLAACAQPTTAAAPVSPPSVIAQNTPVVSPALDTTWFHVSFDRSRTVIDAKGRKVIADVATYLERNPMAIATIVGRADEPGSMDNANQISAKRADAVRDALVYGSKVSATRVETRFSGDRNQTSTMATGAADATSQIVDIAIN